MAQASNKAPSLEDKFKQFTNLNNRESDGTQMTLTQLDFWCEKANIIDGKEITKKDTDTTFNKVVKGSKTMHYADFVKFVDELAASKKVDPKTLKDKLIAAVFPLQ